MSSVDALDLAAPASARDLNSLHRKQHRQASAVIRTLAESDLPAVVRLITRVYPQHRWSRAADCEEYLRSILFANPWHGLDLPSWVAVRGEDVCGLFALMPRPMRLQGRPIKVAAGCQFVVDPMLGNSYIALQLIKTCLAGPQDLTIADGATERVLKLWTGLGGVVPTICNLHWTRPLRPARYAWSKLRRNTATVPAAELAVRPICSFLDAIAARLRPNLFLREASGCVETDLSCAAMMTHLPAFTADRALCNWPVEWRKRGP